MYQEESSTPIQLGLHRLDNNEGRVYTNEREEQREDPETGEKKTVYVYDVYEVLDARSTAKVKNSVITQEHPFGDEEKILRKTLAKVLRASALYDAPEFADFKAYNEFCESL